MKLTTNTTTPRRFLQKGYTILFAAFTLTFSFSFSHSAEAAKVNKPNIIFILTDDQGYGDMACHGHPFLKTPNIDKLYSESARFTNYHVSPTCAPTRAALMSGLDPFRVGVTHTILERERLFLGVKTVANLLKDSGYTTGIFGKWHLGDADEYQPENRGFDEVFIHGAGGIGQNYAGSQGAVKGTSYYNPIIKHNGKFVQTTGYCTDVFFQQALGWIKRQNELKKPFFAYIATNAPHSPYHVADKYKDPYVSEVDKVLHKTKIKTKADAGKTASFFGMITNIDDNMGILLKKLEDWNMVKNTIVIYMTDNGSARGKNIHNSGMAGGKGSMNEGGSRVPFFIRWSGVTKPEQDIPQLARHIDFLPTIVDIAGGKIPTDMETAGMSLLPLIKNSSATTAWPERYLFFNGGRWPKKGAPKRWSQGDTNIDNYKYKHFAVRTSKWRLINNKYLFNIEKDPGEKNNLYKKRQDVATKLRKQYNIWWDSVRPHLSNEDASLDCGKPFIEQSDKQRVDGKFPQWEKPKI